MGRGQQQGPGCGHRRLSGGSSMLPLHIGREGESLLVLLSLGG